MLVLQGFFMFMASGHLGTQFGRTQTQRKTVMKQTINEEQKAYQRSITNKSIEVQRRHVICRAWMLRSFLSVDVAWTIDYSWHTLHNPHLICRKNNRTQLPTDHFSHSCSTAFCTNGDRQKRVPETTVFSAFTLEILGSFTLVFFRIRKSECFCKQSAMPISDCQNTLYQNLK